MLALQLCSPEALYTLLWHSVLRGSPKCLVQGLCAWVSRIWWVSVTEKANVLLVFHFICVGECCGVPGAQMLSFFSVS